MYTKRGLRYFLVASEAVIIFLWLDLRTASHSSLKILKTFFSLFLNANHINEAVMTGIISDRRIIK